MMSSRLTTRVAIGVLITAAMLSIPVGPHDWGDDFALYIMQAAGMTADTWPAPLWVPNPEYPPHQYSPPTYPPGFPAMLAPVYFVAGLNLHAFQIYMSALLVATGYVTYHYASQRLDDGLTSLAVALVVIFHIESLELKQYILSDIPFTLLVIVCLDRLERSSSFVWPVLLVVAAWLVRSVGIVLLLAWIADAVVRAALRGDDPRRTRASLLGAAVASLAIAVLWMSFSDMQGYNASVARIQLFGTIGEQYVVLRDMLSRYLGALFGYDLVVLAGTGFAALLGVGAWASVTRDCHSMSLWFCAGYTALLLGYPHPRGGFRLLLPLVPVLWTYVGRGWLELASRMRATRVIGPAFALGLMALTMRQVYEFSVRSVPASYGPQSAAALELFAAMDRLIPPGALTLSGKPRAMALFTHRRGTSLSPAASQTSVERLVADKDVRFAIGGEPLRNAAVTRYCDTHPDHVIFRNDAFSICRTQ